jgi:hypothetical protein
MNDDPQRPVTLYVESIDTRPNLPRIERERTSTLDIEITEQAAEQLHKFLTERTSAGITGHLTIHSPLSKGGRGEEPANYEYEAPISQQTQAILDAVAEVKQKIIELQAVPAEVQEIKQILQKQEGRWASFVRSIKQFINLIN